MQYYETDDKKGRYVASAAVLLYAAVMVVLFMVVNFTIDVPMQQGSILVDFGAGDSGFGADDTELSDDTVLPESAPAMPAEMLTQDFEPAPEAPLSTAEAAEAEQVVMQSEAKPEEKPVEREVNRRALFPGNTDRAASTSQGAAEGEGNQGATSGLQSDNYAQGGGDGSGISFSLEGRRPVSEFPRPAYDVEEQGRVVIEIAVNAKGEVISAEFYSRGSTTQNATLVAAAKRAAMGARFTPSERNDLQVGTIEYVFRLR